MPLDDFKGKTIVAFIDISGFKKMMDDDEKKDAAWETLQHFYRTGYRLIKKQNNDNKVDERQEASKKKKIAGLFISDCGILFINQNLDDATRNGMNEIITALKKMLIFVKKINRQMFLDKCIMLKTSIAFGKFKFENFAETKDIEKVAIYGDAYRIAYEDVEGLNGTKKLRPGECRIVLDSFPENISERLTPPRLEKKDEVLSLLHQENVGKNYKRLYFYWMVNDPNEIEEFKTEYDQACPRERHDNVKKRQSRRKKCNYDKMKEILRNFIKGDEKNHQGEIC